MADGPFDLNSGSASSLVGGAASGAAAGSIGGPVGMAVGAAVGLGLSAWGMFTNYENAKESSQRQNQIQTAMAQIETQQDDVRRKAMELDASRRSMEIMRNMQRARSLAVIRATTQGAGLGSGIGGGVAQVQQQASWELSGINDNTLFGRSMFSLNAQLNQQKLLMAQSSAESQTNAALGQGLQQAGSSILGSLGPIDRLSRGVNFNQPATNQQPSSYGQNATGLSNSPYSGYGPGGGGGLY